MADGSLAIGGPVPCCRRAEDLIGLLVLGRVDGADRTFVEAHLDVCQPCRAARDQIAVVPRYLDLLTDVVAAPRPESGHRVSVPADSTTTAEPPNPSSTYE